MKLEINFIPFGKHATVEIWTVRPNAAEGGIKVGELEDFRFVAD